MNPSSKGVVSQGAGRQAVFVLGVVDALLGGLSLLLAVSAPFSMGMSEWRSFTDVIMTTVIAGGMPLACAASIAASQWFCRTAAMGVAITIAVLPLIAVGSLVALGIVNG
jgi:hypothetical protein